MTMASYSRGAPIEAGCDPVHLHPSGFLTTLSPSSRDTDDVAGRPMAGRIGDIGPLEPGIGSTWRKQAQRIHTQAQMFYFAIKHPRVHWYAKLVAAGTAGYLFSPIQLIPSFIPVVGLLDDFLVLFLGVKLLQRMIPDDVLDECVEQARIAEMRRKDEIRSTAAVIAFLAVVTVWFFVAITASKLIVLHLFP